MQSPEAFYTISNICFVIAFVLAVAAVILFIAMWRKKNRFKIRDIATRSRKKQDDEQRIGANDMDETLTDDESQEIVPDTTIPEEPKQTKERKPPDDVDETGLLEHPVPPQRFTQRQYILLVHDTDDEEDESDAVEDKSRSLYTA